MLLPRPCGARSIDLNSTTLPWAARIRDHGRETQLFLNSVLVSVAVANAAYVFALLLGSGITPTLVAAIYPGQLWLRPDHILRHLEHQPADRVAARIWRDGRPSIAAGRWRVFLMFSTLIPAHSTMPLLSDWYAVVAAHAFIGGFWIRSLAARIKETRYDPIVRDAVEGHLKSMRGFRDCCGFERQLLVGNMVDDPMVGASRASGISALPGTTRPGRARDFDRSVSVNRAPAPRLRDPGFRLSDGSFGPAAAQIVCITQSSISLPFLPPDKVNSLQ